MYLVPAKSVPKKIEQVTLGFKGLNRLPVTENGELTAMTNISPKYAPCLYPRNSREIVQTLTSGTALFAANGKLCWVDGTNFVYDGAVKGTVTAGKKSIAEYFGIILIFPDAKYYNYTTDIFGNITSAASLGIQYVCVHNNRAYGCGGNGFYTSKVGDPLTWNYLPVPITEGSCWQVNTAEEGNFTGICVFQEQVIAVKAGYTYELYGDKAANFKLVKIVDEGCIDGNSLTVVDGILYMLSPTGFRGYGGSYPDLISRKLNEKYVSCVAGTDGTYYYACLYNGTTYNLYIYYDGQWFREDNLCVSAFAEMGNDLYALAGNKIYKFNSGTEIPAWEIESERFTEWMMGKKVNLAVHVMVELEAGASIQVYTSVDEEDYELQESISATGFMARTLDITPKRAFSFKVKITGTGRAKIYGFARDVLPGSTV